MTSTDSKALACLCLNNKLEAEILEKLKQLLSSVNGGNNNWKRVISSMRSYNPQHIVDILHSKFDYSVYLKLYPILQRYMTRPFPNEQHFWKEDDESL